MKFTVYCAARSSLNTGRIEHLYLDEWVLGREGLVNLHLWMDGQQLAHPHYTAGAAGINL